MRRQLSATPWREDAEIDPLGATIDKAGNVKVRKGYEATAEPPSPEEYRQRIKMVMHSYLLAKLKYPHKQVLQDAGPHHFQKFVDYIVGDQVHGLKAKDEQGNVVSSPAFSLILHYEHQVGKEMVRVLNEGNPLHTSLEEARKDGVIKERFFLTPAAMSALATAEEGWRRVSFAFSPKRRAAVARQVARSIWRRQRQEGERKERQEK